MNQVVWMTLGVIALFAVVAWLAAWSRRDTWARPAAVGLFLVGIPVIAAASVESLGWHKPLRLAWDLKSGDHHVLASKMIQDKAIYLYLDDPNRAEPRPLVLPWDNRSANAIQKAIDGGGSEGKGEFMMRFEPSYDLSDQQFHPLPQPPALPPKEPPRPGERFAQGI